MFSSKVFRNTVSFTDYANGLKFILENLYKLNLEEGVILATFIRQIQYVKS